MSYPVRPLSVSSKSVHIPAQWWLLTLFKNYLLQPKETAADPGKVQTPSLPKMEVKRPRFRKSFFRIQKKCVFSAPRSSMSVSGRVQSTAHQIQRTKETDSSKLPTIHQTHRIEPPTVTVELCVAKPPSVRACVAFTIMRHQNVRVSSCWVRHLALVGAQIRILALQSLNRPFSPIRSHLYPLALSGPSSGLHQSKGGWVPDSKIHVGPLSLRSAQELETFLRSFAAVHWGFKDDSGTPHRALAWRFA